MTNIKLLKVGEKFPINQELAGIVPMASSAEQAALTEDIRANGLREPIVLWKGKIIDGRCRQLACTLANKPIMARELDDTLTEDEVRIFVKSVNTRRNLTSTQKVMSACREALRPDSGTLETIAKAWGISRVVLANAKYIHSVRPDYIETLFNGGTVNVIDTKGNSVSTNKVTTIYAALKREEQTVMDLGDRGWSETSLITTQEGKDWYYLNIKPELDNVSTSTKCKIASLVNDRFVEVVYIEAMSIYYNPMDPKNGGTVNSILPYPKQVLDEIEATEHMEHTRVCRVDM